MQNDEPLVSIVINCFNGEKYLKEALSSIKKQKYQNFEVIFWDNFSNDESKKIFLDFADNRFKYFFSDKKLKLYDARNHALSKCQGDLITLLTYIMLSSISFLNSYESSGSYPLC